MNSLLPNLRLLTLPSEHQGQDYPELCCVIDRELENLGYDLEEESVYILFKHFPHGPCLVARPVIGPLKATENAKLLDLESRPVTRQTLSGVSWEALMSELTLLQGKDQKNLTLRLSRRIENGHLRLTAEGIIHD
jgi:hypothetical protein